MHIRLFPINNILINYITIEVDLLYNIREREICNIDINYRFIILLLYSTILRVYS